MGEKHGAGRSKGNEESVWNGETEAMRKHRKNGCVRFAMKRNSGEQAKKEEIGKERESGGEAVSPK
jgi:hypothetical protein